MSDGEEIKDGGGKRKSRRQQHETKHLTSNRTVIVRLKDRSSTRQFAYRTARLPDSTPPDSSPTGEFALGKFVYRTVR